MISADSRYATGEVYLSYNARKGQYDATLRRSFPREQTAFFLYEWAATDRIDRLARDFLGDGNAWWRIMDINPEVLNPFDIPVGTKIRIPEGG